MRKQHLLSFVIGIMMGILGYVCISDVLGTRVHAQNLNRSLALIYADLRLVDHDMNQSAYYGTNNELTISIQGHAKSKFDEAYGIWYSIDPQIKKFGINNNDVILIQSEMDIIGSNILPPTSASKGENISRETIKRAHKWIETFVSILNNSNPTNNMNYIRNLKDNYQEILSEYQQLGRTDSNFQRLTY